MALKGNVIEIIPSIAREFVIKWHYSKRFPTGRVKTFGWYIDDLLYAVAVYGDGINSYQTKFLKDITGYEITNSNLIEIRRLCRIEPKLEECPLTYFIAKCNKKVKELGYKYIIAFSDPAYNHNGGIYKAANFTYLGKTAYQTHFIDSSGVIRHKKYVYRYAKRLNIRLENALKILDLKRVKVIPKDRWFIKL